MVLRAWRLLTKACPRPSSPTDVAGAARRVDWRFLLPPHGPPVGPSALRLIADEPDLVPLLEVLRQDGRVLDGFEDTAEAGLVVVLTGRLRDIDRAVRSLPPEGVLYCEVDRARRSGIAWSPGRLQRRLTRSGLSTTAYWRRRQTGRDTLFLPLGAPGALTWYLRELMDGRRFSRRVARRALESVGGAQALGRAVRHYGVVGVAGVSPQGANVTPEVLTGRALTDAPLLPLVLARGQGAWSRVVLLPFSETDRQPRCVVKLPRTPEHNEATQREHAVLRELAGRLAPPLVRGIPEALSLECWRGLYVGAEEFLPGLPLAVTGNLAPAADWLADLHRATQVYQVPAEGPRAHELVDAQLLEAVATVGLSLPAASRLLGRQGMRSAAGARLPVVLEHGDVTPQNLRWDGGRYSLVDWESARIGPALCDLLYLLLHWPWPGLPVFAAAPLQVFRSVFASQDLPPARTAAGLVLRYCKNLPLDPRLVPPLLLAMLSRQALDRAARVRNSGQDPARDHNVYADLIGVVLDAREALPAWTVVQ